MASDTDEIAILYRVFSIPQAAALWCGVTEENLSDVASEAKPLLDGTTPSGVFRLDSLKGFEERSRAINDAMSWGRLSFIDENGVGGKEVLGIKASRRHVLGKDLRDWIEKSFPNERPAFLFPANLTYQEPPAELSPRSETCYQHIIAALLEYINGQTPGVDPHPAFENSTRLIKTLSEQYAGYDGMSESNLARKLPEATRTLAATK